MISHVHVSCAYDSNKKFELGCLFFSLQHYFMISYAQLTCRWAALWYNFLSQLTLLYFTVPFFTAISCSGWHFKPFCFDKHPTTGNCRLDFQTGTFDGSKWRMDTFNWKCWRHCSYHLHTIGSSYTMVVVYSRGHKAIDVVHEAELSKNQPQVTQTTISDCSG